MILKSSRLCFLCNIPSSSRDPKSLNFKCKTPQYTAVVVVVPSTLRCHNGAPSNQGEQQATHSLQSLGSSRKADRLVSLQLAWDNPLYKAP